MAGFAALSLLYTRGAASPDLLASWLAGAAFREGDLANVYAVSRDLFTMLPPAGWAERLGTDWDGPVYPFIYPPLWAWAVGLLTEVTSYEGYKLAARIVNPLLLSGSVLLAGRIAFPGIAPERGLALGLLLVCATVGGVVAVEQNQPAILVAFLLVAAAERHVAGRPVAAGAALALAAALKLYPALFALLFLARGDRRAAGAFAVFGGALGLLSIAVAGWPLHEVYLHEVRAIAGTILSTYHSYALDAAGATVFAPSSFVFVQDPGAAPGIGRTIMARPAAVALAGRALLVAGLLGLALLYRRRGDPLVWPAAFVLVALFSPLTWSYHYLPALVFLPALWQRLGTAGAVLGLFALAPVSVVALTLPGWQHYAQASGTLGMAFLGAAFVAAVLAPRAAREGPLQRHRQPL